MEKQIKDSNHTVYGKGLGTGILLMVIGVLFLGFNFGLIDSPLKRVIFSWPMILVVIGVVKTIKRDYFTAAILYVIGFFFLMPKIIHAYPQSFPGMDGNFTHIYWPLLLIVGGIFLIMKRLYGKPWEFSKMEGKHHCSKNAYNGPVGSFSKNSIFGGGEHIVLEPDFKGGEINAVFGGLTLDLRHTNLAEGTSRLDVNAVFGGVTIFVPTDWFVETHIDAVFGGFEDKRLVKLPLNTERKLLITGACVFGGGELSN